MGAALERFWKRLFGPKEVRILMLGLDSAGKTSILYKLKMGEVVSTVPTLGFNIETVSYKNVSLVVWDLCGQEKNRPQWPYYFQDTKGVIFVVDSTDVQRMCEARAEFFRVLSADELQEAPILVLANKQDLPRALSEEDIIELLGLRRILHRQWHVQCSSVPTGQGLLPGLDWLATTINSL